MNPTREILFVLTVLLLVALTLYSIHQTTNDACGPDPKCRVQMESPQ